MQSLASKQNFKSVVDEYAGFEEGREIKKMVGTSVVCQYPGKRTQN
jgi:hypothetical protein